MRLKMADSDQERDVSWYEGRIAELESKLNKARECLEKLEWLPSILLNCAECYMCGAIGRKDGHKPNCQLAATLRELEVTK